MSTSNPTIARPATSVATASVDDIEKLVRLRKLLLSQGNGHYVSTSPEDDNRWQTHYAEWLAKHIEAGTEYIRIAVAKNPDDEITGCAIGIIDDRAPVPGCLNGRLGWVQTVIVEPSARHQGIALQMMRFLLHWFNAQAVGKVALQTTPVARQLYRRLGFRTSGEDLLIATLDQPNKQGVR
jgi:GNAT superfamily N-acetyltransferase